MGYNDDLSLLTNVHTMATIRINVKKETIGKMCIMLPRLYGYIEQEANDT
jgi:hypothetical protein